MRIKRFVIALSLLSISISPLASCEPIKELTKQELFSIYSDKIKDLHIPYINTDKIKYDALPKMKNKSLKGKIIYLSILVIGLILLVLTGGNILFYMFISLVLFGILRSLYYFIIEKI